MQSDRWTRSLTHSKLCVYKSNVSSSRPHFQERSRYLSYNPKFPFALFSVCLVPQKQEEKERKNVVSGFLHNHFLSLLCVEFQHFSNGYSCFDCLIRFFFSSRFCSCVCGCECWLLPPKGHGSIDLFAVIRYLWELSIPCVCCGEFYVAHNLFVEMLSPVLHVGFV